MDILENHGSLREDRSLRSRERVAPFTPELKKARRNAAIARRLDMVHNGTSANCYAIAALRRAPAAGFPELLMFVDSVLILHVVDSVWS